jgi:hypothetical protein
MRRLALGTILSAAVGIASAHAQTPPETIFADGFESGDLSAWSFGATDGEDLTAQAGAAMAATSFGLQAVVDDTVGVYVEDGSPADESRYRARFYFDPSGFDPGEATGAFRTRIFIGFEEAPSRRLFAIVLKRQGGQYSVMGRVRRNDGSQADTGFFPISAGEHWVELDWVRASSGVASDGTFQMWLDGQSVSTLTGVPNGISAIDFVRMGALSVKPGATGILRWDQFASRRQTQIGPSLDSGTACAFSDQCGTAHCVDNVCCNSTCGGTCSRCDVAGSEGTCAPAPAGTDPDQECGAVSCAGYYHGWSGDTCFRKADVGAAQAVCNGAGACQTVAQQCTAAPMGTAAITCDSLCQDPTGGTCSGTTAGACTNVSQGSLTCGSGPCQVTVPRCVAGVPNQCVPNSGAATTETCNGIDDNCDGTIDNGQFSDAQEPNGDCSSYRSLPTVGSNQTLTQTTLTLYASGDVDYYRIPAVESDNSCSCCDAFCFDEDYQLKVTLTVPAGAGSYTFCTSTTCDTVGTYCQTVFAGSSAFWTWTLDGGCPGSDSYNIFVRVSPGNPPGYQCHPYTLSYNFVPGCFAASPTGERGVPVSEPGGPQSQ